MFGTNILVAALGLSVDHRRALPMHADITATLHVTIMFSLSYVSTKMFKGRAKHTLSLYI